jgi:hypothetical protein
VQRGAADVVGNRVGLPTHYLFGAIPIGGSD